MFLLTHHRKSICQVLWSYQHILLEHLSLTWETLAHRQNKQKAQHDSLPSYLFHHVRDELNIFFSFPWEKKNYSSSPSRYQVLEDLSTCYISRHSP